MNDSEDSLFNEEAIDAQIGRVCNDGYLFLLYRNPVQSLLFFFDTKATHIWIMLILENIFKKLSQKGIIQLIMNIWIQEELDHPLLLYLSVRLLMNLANQDDGSA